MVGQQSQVIGKATQSVHPLQERLRQEQEVLDRARLAEIAQRQHIDNLTAEVEDVAKNLRGQRACSKSALEAEDNVVRLRQGVTHRK